MICKHKKKCIDCDKEISSMSIRCKSCSNKFRKGKYKWKSNKSKLGQNNPKWKPIEKIKTNAAFHKRMWKLYPRKELCEECNKRPPHDLANISGNYKTEINDWEWLCRRCHMLKDGRMKNLIWYREKNVK